MPTGRTLHQTDLMSTEEVSPRRVVTGASPEPYACPHASDRGTSSPSTQSSPSPRSNARARRRQVDPEAMRRATAAPPPPGPPTGSPPDGGCLVCHAPGTSRREVRYLTNPSLRKTVNLCRRCGYLAIDELGPSHRRAGTSLDQLPAPEQRMGTVERPGCEYQMARMALQILGRKKPQNVLVYGAGRSLHDRHIQRLPRVGTVAIADIMRAPLPRSGRARRTGGTRSGCRPLRHPPRGGVP